MNSYRELTVWQKSMELVELIYKIVVLFPKYEEHCLSKQIRRCVVSIPSNIAEGYGRNYTEDYKRFLCIARGSLYELQTQMQIATRLKYINNTHIALSEDLVMEIEKMLNTLIKKL
ncbi:MAG: four helix bundle protein [Bacteroidales bacterium]|nr:four helix bundle protein [Bacteroidales bacterium]